MIRYLLAAGSMAAAYAYGVASLNATAFDHVAAILARIP